MIVLLAFIGLSLLILGHEAGHFFVAKLFNLKIDEFGFGFPPRIFARKKGETEYSLNSLPFGGFVRIAGENDGMIAGMENEGSIGDAEKKRLFYFQPAWKKALIIAAGISINFIIGWFLLSLVLMVGTPKILVVSGVQKNSPAEQAGFLAGDIVKDYTDSKSFIDFVNLHKGESTNFTVIRNGKDVNLTATPRTEVNPNEGAIGVFLGEGGEPKLGFFSAIWNGFTRSLTICALTISAFYDLAKNLILHGSLLDGIVGPVGVFSVAQEAGRVGFFYLVQLIALISLNLSVVNLIPFPALDGGRLLLIVIEKIKKSPLSKKAEVIVNVAGFAVLIVLMVLLTVRDIARLF